MQNINNQIHDSTIHSLQEYELRNSKKKSHFRSYRR